MPLDQVRRRRWRVASAVGLVSTLLLLVVAAAFRSVDLALISSLDAVLTTVIKAIELLRFARPPPPASGAKLAEAKGILADLVYRQWCEESRIRSLGDPHPIPVAWHLTRRCALMDHPHQIASKQRLTFTGSADDITDLTEQFRRLDRGRLVITGGPGMGKTTLAVQLVLDLLHTRTEEEPVPVMLSLAGWDTDAHPRLHQWLAERLAVDYPALRAGEFSGTGASEALAAGNHILPVLDGLDELPCSARAEIIRVLNRSLTDRDRLILTSRTAEFADAVRVAGDVLTGAAVIAPLALTPSVAADYLRSCLPPVPRHDWTRVLEAMRTGVAPALAAVATTPLGLWLIRMVYIVSNADPAPLLGPIGRHTSMLRCNLLDQLIPALIHARPATTGQTGSLYPRHTWEPDQARLRLSHLADLMRRNNTRDLAWWNIARYITTPFRRRLLQVMIGLVAGSVTFLVLLIHVARGEARFVLGVVAGILAGFVVGRWFEQRPGSLHLSIKKLPAAMVLALGAALATWTLTVSVAGIGGNLALDKAGGTLAYAFVVVVYWLGLLAGIAAAQVVLIKRWERVAVLTSTSTPISIWRADRNLTLVRVLAAGTIFGLVYFAVGSHDLVFQFEGEAIGLSKGLAPTVSRLLVGGLVGGLQGALIGRHHAWLLHMLVASISPTIRPSAKLMPFLDDMHRLGVLRTVGPVYQFRHAELQDHLASRWRPEGDYQSRPQQASAERRIAIAIGQGRTTSARTARR